MFVVLLRFGENKALAPTFMDAHKNWIQAGLDDNVFMVVGSLQPNQGGAILVNNTSRDDLETRLAADPFVAEGVVLSEILEISPNQTIEQLKFLKE